VAAAVKRRSRAQLSGKCCSGIFQGGNGIIWNGSVSTNLLCNFVSVAELHTHVKNHVVRY
jgi:hypothetical protein